MEVSNPNNIKIYNLSCGKSLPEFISDKRRRSLLKKDVDLQRRIELIQDFGMPTVSTTVRTSKNQQYIFATGTYKPCVRCYDVKELSLKFERCLDCEVVTFDILSEDYSKVVFLLKDRHVEFHTQQGSHYSTRIPKFGRDLAYHTTNCDLMVVGAGPEIYRLNLDQGRFLKSYETHSPELTKCVVNEDHQLVVVGGVDGHIECWDPRSKCRAGILDCSLGLANMHLDDTPQVSAIKFKSALHMAVGTSTGHVLLYDIRSNKPRVVKDHRYELPIHSIAFNETNRIVLSSDARSVKLWDESTGEAVTAVEMEHDINDFHIIENSGLFFLANESPKIHTYFIPMLGPAPRWCSFLDNLTEELEENPVQEIYDDYKFLTLKEIESLGLSNLIGTSLLRAYMHGYFIDMRLHRKAVSIANPFAYKEYRQKKIAEKIEEARANRVHVKKLPKVNRNLAQRLLHQADSEETRNKKKLKLKKGAANLLEDNRFKAIFEDPSFQVDEESEEFRLLNRVAVKRSEKIASKTREEDDENLKEDVLEDDGVLPEDVKSEERSWIRDSKQDKGEAPKKKKKSEKIDLDSRNKSRTRMFELKSDVAESGRMFSTFHDLDALAGEEARREKMLKSSVTLEDRIKDEERKGGKSDPANSSGGRRETTFTLEQGKAKKEKRAEDRRHFEERRKLRRPANKLSREKVKSNPFFKHR